jgi:type II secretory pathway pseudopilin PulG
MNLVRTPNVRRAAAFTMVELALCIAVVAIAMVAVIGVLPAGMNVQKQNREETIIDQDATMLMDAIRNGAIQFDDITNYVDYIVLHREQINAPKGTGHVTNGFVGVWFNGTLGNVPPPKRQLDFAQEVLGLLSLPKYDFNIVDGEPSYTNHVTAQFRAFSGALNDKVLPQRFDEKPQAAQLNFAFRYLVDVEIVPVVTRPLSTLSDLPQLQQAVLGANLFDVQLTYRWPVVGDEIPARVGGNEKSYRVQVAARLEVPKDPFTGVITNMPGTQNLHIRRFDPGSLR